MFWPSFYCLEYNLPDYRDTAVLQVYLKYSEGGVVNYPVFPWVVEPLRPVGLQFYPGDYTESSINAFITH